MASIWGQCPFNPTHKILASKLQYHILKCKNSAERSEYVTCPYNSTHLYPKSEEQKHLSDCLDYARIITDLPSVMLPSDENNNLPNSLDYSQTNNTHPTSSTNSTNSPQDNTTQEKETESEMWDDEAEIVTYDPKLICTGKRVLRMLQLASTKEKKEFRQKEKIRHKHLDMETNNTHPTEDLKSVSKLSTNVPTCSTSSAQSGDTTRIKNDRTSSCPNGREEIPTFSINKSSISSAAVSHTKKSDGYKTIYGTGRFRVMYPSQYYSMKKTD